MFKGLNKTELKDQSLKRLEQKLNNSVSDVNKVPLSGKKSTCVLWRVIEENRLKKGPWQCELLVVPLDKLGKYPSLCYKRQLRKGGGGLTAGW